MQEIRSSNKENMVHTDEVHVACPCCKNKRLFDADPMTEGIIKINPATVEGQFEFMNALESIILNVPDDNSENGDETGL